MFITAAGLLAKTLTWARSNGWVEPTATAPTYGEKETALATFIRSTDFGCKSESVVKLVEMMIDSKLPPLTLIGRVWEKPDNVVMEPGLAVVITDTNGRFQSGRIMLTADAHGSSRSYGHLIDPRDMQTSGDFCQAAYLRPATLEECTTLVAELAAVVGAPNYEAGASAE